MKIFKEISKKAVSVIAVFAVILLNFSSVVQCGSMLLEDDCCHKTNIIKPCCAKNVKITSDPRIKGHCGCNMKESQQSGDLYIDLSNGYNRNSLNTTADIEFSKSENLIINNNYFSSNYSPPEISQGEVYLLNMNLRI